MKGVLFNISEEFIVENYGDQTLDEILDHCNLSTKDPFVSPGNYPFSDLVEIISVTSSKVNLSMDKVLISLGRFAFGKLAKRHPEFVELHTHPKPFLKTVEDVIHVEVHKLYSDSQLPTFQYEDLNDKELIITYYSKKKLYPLMQGLIEGVGDHFNTRINQTKRIYIDNDVEYCDFHLKFE